jgi:hypothetical protein
VTGLRENQEINIAMHPTSAMYIPVTSAQLPGRLSSPSDISKKLSHHFLLHFFIDIGSYDHQAKYQGVFPDLLEKTFFIRVPPLDE